MALLGSVFLALAILLALTIPVNERPYEDGKAAFDRGDYATALKFWRLLAKQGDAKGQTLLGLMYAQGKGSPQNYGEAEKWFRRAAEQGHAEAQYSFGVMYADGKGVTRDDALAHMWFNLAAEHGYERAQGNQDKAASQMTPDQIDEARRMAREWMAKHQR